ncbi:hypothetical protein HS088_TW12G00115 [Tripterygium wilfordii]|uniref:WAT1-related protein n=1 Tax=Tripterygium wilfordii TaxID=458696 RepID=A0A7J7CY83_TRIWF|nr:hypothetical protein HS088_TW12G00115 [Tripterygium wilfordii]
MYFMSMRYTSPTFVTAIINTIQSLTFIIAVVLRLEDADIRNARGIAEVLGTLISCIGAIIITSYRGPAVHSLEGSPIHIRSSSNAHENWLKGSILAVASCILWTFCFFSILGSAIVIIGLYLLLWGKGKDQYVNKSQLPSCAAKDVEKELKIQTEALAEREMPCEERHA